MKIYVDLCNNCVVFLNMYVMLCNVIYVYLVTDITVLNLVISPILSVSRFTL